MDPTVISSTEATRHLGDYLAWVKHKGERFILTKNDQPIAVLSPAAGSLRATWGELKAVMGAGSGDPTFANDLERINEADEITTNPWD